MLTVHAWPRTLHLRTLATLAAALGLSLAAGSGSRAADGDWSAYLSRGEVGADRWLAANPAWDGRGVVVAVLDTGVDPSQPGLTALPDGSPKVIDARDFSGQGRVTLERARLDGGLLIAKDLELRGVEQLADRPLGRTGYWVGVFEEKALRRSAVEDIDGDGRTDSTFAVVAFLRADGEEVVIVDTNGDGDLSDEVVRRSYRDDPRYFYFGRAPKRRIAVTATVKLAEREVELHFDDGSHGTHCAGIAAGYRIEGRDGFHGIAPGASVMSLKIGHGALSGGATVKGSMVAAIRYASAFARDERRWVVISLSYGIGSETEGDSEIDRVLDEELTQNPWLVAAVSAGNSGPGLSSMGTPAAATLAFATAAMVTPAQAERLLGAGGLRAPRVFTFSSRGGELDKPDGMAPGIAWSTVPAHHSRSIMNGTSMAAPQVAGVMALLLSAAAQTGTVTSAGIVRRALRQGARPLAGYTRLDQGPGVVQVGASWEAMKAAAGKVPVEVAGFEVKTALPGAPGRTGSASYWRVGAGLAGLGAAVGERTREREVVSFRVRPMIHGTVDDEAIPAIFQSVSLDSDVGWLRVDRRELPFRGDGAVDVPVSVELAKVARPGVHVGRVRARQAGLWAFDLPVVVVVPTSFRDTWVRRFEGQVGPVDVARFFVEVPPGASAMSAELTVERGEGSLWLIPFDPAGRHHDAYDVRASREEALVGRFARSGAELDPGTWELTVVAPVRNRGAAGYALTVQFTAIDGPAALAVATDGGGRSEATLRLVNRMDQPFSGALEARVVGLTRTQEVTLKDARREVAIDVGAGTRELELELEVDEAAWARLTDLAFDVLDEAGRAVAQDAFGQRRTRVTVATPAPGPTTYRIALVAGLVDAADERPLTVTVTETQTLAQPVTWSVKPPSGQARPTLHPGVATSFGLSASGLPARPDGFALVTELALVARDEALWQRWRLAHVTPGP